MNDIAMAIANNEFDKAHCVESWKEAYDGEGDVSIGRLHWHYIIKTNLKLMHYIFGSFFKHIYNSICHGRYMRIKMR